MKRFHDAVAERKDSGWIEKNYDSESEDASDANNTRIYLLSDALIGELL
jgi:hypothetical protein